ncbi:unnamed protein product [Rotaria sp. Silwood1]|nr:unnamed protein product [Rotaria sp. Silwood1]
MNFTELNKLTEQATSKLHESVHNIESLKQWKAQMFSLIDAIAELKLPSSSSSLLQTTDQHLSFDPVNWPSARRLAHSILDSSLDFIQNIRDHPAWQPVPVDVRTALEHDALPEYGRPMSDISQDMLKYILPYSIGHSHPRFWGWASGEGTFGSLLADIIASAMNTTSSGGTQSAILVERTVIEWMRQLFNFPPKTTAGLVISGTSMATIISMAAARHHALFNVRQDGLVNGTQLVAYASTETHICVIRALELLGLGSKAMHFISVDENFCINIDELKKAIREDREKGLTPFCIIGNAGTVNTGAFDNLLELSSIAHSEHIWLHIDGAFGSLVVLDPNRRHLVAGIDQADSLAFDFHKWLHCQYDAGCVLIRDVSHLNSTFSLNQSYLASSERGCSGYKPWFSDHGPELSRTFRALRVWFTLKEHGTVKIGQKIADNCQQAQYLASLLEKHSFIRIIRPISLNIVNFRLEPKEFADADSYVVDVFNNELVADIQLSGIAVVSTTNIHKQIYIRVAIISHRSTLEDFDIFVKCLLDLHQARLRTSSSNQS